MAGVAQLARESGHTVTGSDASVYPPMSTLLEELGVDVAEGYAPATIPGSADVVIVGNAMSRGNPAVEYLLDSHRPFTSGPQWLRDHVLLGRRVIAVAGTHGKTSTSSMICHVLRAAGVDCGYLIGGVPGNLDRSAALGSAPWFVVEADEYDTAFFDKRSKFVHYYPDIAVINNLEYDHADIFDSLDAIKRQFHHLLRTVPSQGAVIYNGDDENVIEVLQRGCYSRRASFGQAQREHDFRLERGDRDWRHFSIVMPDSRSVRICWDLFGRHNAVNALAAMAASVTLGIEPRSVANALSGFRLPLRRLQELATRDGITLYEDFAHHPTAIRATLGALRERHTEARLVAIVEPRSNTMRLGHHGDALALATLGLATDAHHVVRAGARSSRLGWLAPTAPTVRERAGALGAQAPLTGGEDEPGVRHLAAIRDERSGSAV